MLNMYAFLVAGLFSFAHVGAHPTVHDNSLVARSVDLNAFRLKATSEYVNASVAESPSVRLRRREDYIETATELVKSIVNGATFRVVQDHYVGTNGIAHVNFKQTAHDIDIDNADFNVNVSIQTFPPSTHC
jgi:extracellular elastinolytic metalloproteinase